MDLVATVLTGPAATWFNGQSETSKANWISVFFKKIATITAHFRAQAETQTIKILKLKPEDSTSIFACKVEDVVDKASPELDTEKGYRKYVIVFIQVLPYNIKHLDNGCKLENIPPVDAPIIMF